VYDDDPQPHPLEEQLADAIADELLGKTLVGAHERIARTVLDLLIAEGIVQPADRFWEYGNGYGHDQDVDPAVDLEQAETFLRIAPEYTDISRRRRAATPGPWATIRH